LNHAIQLICSEEEIKIVAPYKLRPQARFIINKMNQVEKNVQEVLSRLALQLESIERKVDDTPADLEKVQERVDLTMSSISVVQEEQVQVIKLLKSVTGASGASMGDDIMGAAPSSASTPSIGQQAPPPPPPPPHQPDRFGRPNQVNPNPPSHFPPLDDTPKHERSEGRR
jgi:hypothetical protein